MIDTPLDRIAFRLPGGVEAAGAARRAIVAGDGQLPAGVRADVLLLVTELVTNAVRHAGAGPDRPVEIEVLRRPGFVAGAVADDGPGYTWRPTSLTGDETGGWGLFLVERIADRWGVQCTPAGSRVWFEIVYAE